MELRTVKQRLKACEKDIRRLGIRQLGIFGSYARGDQDQKSDLDLAAEFVETPSLLGLIRAERYLSERIGVKVDLVNRKGLKPRFSKAIRRDLVMV